MDPISVPGNKGLIAGLIILGITLCGLLFTSLRLRKTAEIARWEKEYTCLVNSQEEANRSAKQGF